VKRLATASSAVRDRGIGELVAEALGAGHAVRFRALGSSMTPAIWPGDILVAKPANGSSPKLGEIVLILSDRGLQAHRVVARRAAGQSLSIVTRGDAMPKCDAVVPGSAGLGTVVSRNGRRLRRARPARGFYAVADRIVSCAPLRWFRLRSRALRLCATRYASGIASLAPKQALK
jgi:hypothetical protein